MQLDVEVSPPAMSLGLSLPRVTDDLGDHFWGYCLKYELFSTTFGLVQTTDRQKVTHRSPLCNMHRWAKKFNFDREGFVGHSQTFVNL